ncbi:MAG: glycosyltransferase family 4 protein [Desulfobacterales bacterium]|nr:glycosyltransferase family 4 protein [Desulfobacterales bacterium]
MNILVDAIPLKGLLTGVSRYLRNLYKEIEQLQDVTVYYYDGRRCGTSMPEQANPDSWMKSVDRVWKLPDPVVVGLRSVFWLSFEQKLRRVLRRNRFDVYHETAFTPAAVKASIPQVFTLYDLSLMKFRDLHPRERVWFSDLFFQRRIRHADHIITGSDYIRSEIIEELNIPPHQVTAIHDAADPLFYPRENEKVKSLLSDLKIPGDYLLFVGTFEPRKNLAVLIKALAELEKDIPLVLVGWKGWGEKSWQEKAREAGLDKQIFVPGYIDEESLACLYSGALALVYPSLYEGFGLPVVEAMSCACPVICSNAASLPEVAGDAALFIDPNDAEGLANAIDRVAGDSLLRNGLIEKGLERTTNFSWKKAAKQTLEVFQAVADKR